MSNKKHDEPLSHANNFRVAVLGQSGVGKTAFVVRFTTEKFIGDYDSNLEMIYQRLLLTSSTSDLVMFEVVDSTEKKKENTEILQEKIKWADAYILLYSVTDRLSFSSIDRLKFLILYAINNQHTCCNQTDLGPPIIVVANKKDSVFERMVSTQEGSEFALELNCPFFEISVRESVDDVIQVFASLYEMHKQLKKRGFSKRHGTFGPHFDLPLISQHHLSVPLQISKSKPQKYVESLIRMQGSASTLRIQKDGDEPNKIMTKTIAKKHCANSKSHDSNEDVSSMRHHSSIRTSTSMENNPTNSLKML